MNFIRSFFSSAVVSKPPRIMEAQTKAQRIINENPVVVFSKSYCPFCNTTKALLSEYGAKAYVLELDEIDDGAAIQDDLKMISGRSTVPNIFIGQKNIGGNQELQARKAELADLLKNAGAI